MNCGTDINAFTPTSAAAAIITDLTTKYPGFDFVEEAVETVCSLHRALNAAAERTADLTVIQWRCLLAVERHPDKWVQKQWQEAVPGAYYPTRHAMRELIKKGLIETYNRPGKTGGRPSLAYRLTDPFGRKRLDELRPLMHNAFQDALVQEEKTRSAAEKDLDAYIGELAQRFMLSD